MIRNPACNSEMTLWLNYWHLQGSFQCFQCLVTFSALGKVWKNIFLICCCSSSVHSHGYVAQHLWTAQGTHRVSCMSETGHNFLLMAANPSDLLTKHGYSQGQRPGMRPTSTIGTAYFSITDCTVNLSLSRAVTGRERAISRHHLRDKKQLEISAIKTLTLHFSWI